MAQELQSIGLGSLAGVEHRGSKLTVAETNAVFGSKNWYLKAIDEITGIEGYTQLSNVQTSQVRRIYSFTFRNAGGVIVTELVAVAGTLLWRIDPASGNFTSIGGTLNSTGPVSIAEMDGKLFIATGGTAPVHVYNPITGAISAIDNTRPAVPTLAVGAATDAPCKGLYKVRYRAVYADGDTGWSSLEASISVSQQDFVVTIPAPVDPTDIVGHDVFVRPPGPIEAVAPDYYYRSGYVDIAAVAQTWTHAISDGELRLEVELDGYGEPPPAGARFVATALDRLWVGSWPGELSTVRVSDPSQPTSFGNPSSYRVNPGDNDEMVGIVTGVYRLGETSRNLLMTVFKRRAIYNILDTGEQAGLTGNVLSVMIERSKSRMGAISEQCIVQAPLGDQTLYLFIAPDGTIRSFDGSDSKDISAPVRDYLADLNFAAGPTAFGYYLLRKKMVVWHYPRGTSVHPNFALGLMLETGNWVVFPDWPLASCATEHRTLDSEERYYMAAAVASGSTFPFYRQFYGNSFAGAPITWQWRSKPLFTSTGTTRVFEYIEPVCLIQPGAFLNVKTWRGFENPDTAPPWTDHLMPLDVPGMEFIHEVIPLENDDGDRMVDHEVTVQFGGTSTIQKPTLVGFRFGFRNKPRKRFEIHTGA